MPPPRWSWGICGYFLHIFPSGLGFMGSAGRISHALSPKNSFKPLWPFNHFYRSLHLERMVKTFINPQKPSVREVSLDYLPFCPSHKVSPQGSDELGQGRHLWLPQTQRLWAARMFLVCALLSCCSRLQFERKLASHTGKREFISLFFANC